MCRARHIDPTSGHMGACIGSENGFTGTKKQVFGSAQNVATSMWIWWSFFISDVIILYLMVQSFWSTKLLVILYLMF